MRILWKSHPTDPSKNGTLEHVCRDLAAVACGYGQASPAPFKDFRERLAFETAQRTGPQPGDSAVTLPLVDEWGVKAPDGECPAVVILKKTPCGETLRYLQPTSEMPPHIVQRFEELSHIDPGASAAQFEKDKRAQQDYDQRSKTWKRW